MKTIAWFGIGMLNATCCCATDATVSSPCQLRPVLMEEFNELSISSNKIGPARWTAHTPWNGDFGDAQFQDPTVDGVFAAHDGMLSVTASKDEKGKWRSGLIAGADASGAGQGAQYGYFEVRMKMPPGPGTWPAFWLMPLKPTSAADGRVEIDVIEYYGHATDEYRAGIHVWRVDPSKTTGDGSVVPVTAGSLVNDFHTYGVDISPSDLVFFFDGQPVWRRATPVQLNSKMYPLVNLALGSGWPIRDTPNPSRLLVDYVHVYERDAGPGTDCPPGLPRG